jgi:hypothetical protein
VVGAASARTRGAVLTRCGRARRRGVTPRRSKGMR